MNTLHVILCIYSIDTLKIHKYSDGVIILNILDEQISVSRAFNCRCNINVTYRADIWTEVFSFNSFAIATVIILYLQAKKRCQQLLLGPHGSAALLTPCHSLTHTRVIIFSLHSGKRAPVICIYTCRLHTST